MLKEEDFEENVFMWNKIWKSTRNWNHLLYKIKILIKFGKQYWKHNLYTVFDVSVEVFYAKMMLFDLIYNVDWKWNKISSKFIWNNVSFEIRITQTRIYKKTKRNNAKGAFKIEVNYVFKLEINFKFIFEWDFFKINITSVRMILT